MVFDAAEVDDILQDVAVIAIENSHRYDSERSLSAWIFGIAKNRILKYYEKQKRSKLCFSTEVVEAMTEVSENADEREDSLESLQDCMAKLEPAQRDLLLRRHKPGVTARALAKEIGYTDTRISRKINGLYALLLKCVQQQLSVQT